MRGTSHDALAGGRGARSPLSQHRPGDIQRTTAAIASTSCAGIMRCGVATIRGIIGEGAKRRSQRGDISHALREPDLASNLYEAAIDVARQQEVKFWELRASVHLAWHDQGKREEARELLAPVYGWFTEGYNDETVKLEKARFFLSIAPLWC
jgi:hypothetical protein